MELEALKSIFESFNLADFLPEISSILGWVETFLRLGVMAGPLILLALGLIYLLAPPKEANYAFGYRFWWSMASLDAWQYTHRLVGIVWTVLGLILTVVMAVICNAFRRMEPMDMVWSAGKCLLWQIGIVAVSCLVMNILIVVVFDSRGFRRREQ